MYCVDLCYGYDEAEDGIYHAFEAVDPEAKFNVLEMEAALAELLDLEPTSERFNWNIMRVKIPDSLVERIQKEAVQEYKKYTL